MSKTDDFETAIKKFPFLSIVSTTNKAGTITALCRLAKGEDKQLIAMSQRLLPIFKDSMKICKRYIMKDNNLVFGVEVSLIASTAKELEGLISKLTEATSTQSFVYSQLTPKAVSERTSARSALPGKEGKQEPTPSGFKFVMTARNVTGADGTQQSIVEMPLPHQYSDKNVPNHKGRGAKGL